MTKSIKTVGVCGAAGTMGAGIALVAARAGYRTISYDRTSPPLEKAAKQSRAFLDKSVERGKLEPEARGTGSRQSQWPSASASREATTTGLGVGKLIDQQRNHCDDAGHGHHRIDMA